MGRNTQGVKLINIREDDAVATVCRTDKSEEEDQDGEAESSQDEGQAVEGQSLESEQDHNEE